MPFVQPARRRSFVVSERGVLHVEIRMRKHPFLIIFLLAWLGGWSFGGVMAAKQLFVSSEMPGDARGFMAFWLVGWAVGETFVTVFLAYLLFGKERLQLSRAAFVIRVEALGLGFTRAYDPGQVTRLRATPSVSQGMGFGMRESPVETGTTIAFDYGAKTVRFGRGLDEAEAAILVDELAATGAFPQVDAATGRASA